jgi:asparagine synthase (glutamine-hydrolysing)
VLEGWFAPFSAPERKRLVGRADGHGQRDVVARSRGDIVRRMLYVDCHAWLADNLLERGDRMTMAASVELRPPFLDVDVVELAFRLPTAVKLHNGTGKWVVKEIARRYLPDSIVDRRKVGFRVPLDAWFRSGLRAMANDLLLGSSSFVGRVMDQRAIRQLLTDHERGRRNEEIRIWTLLSLEVWHREFFG